MCVQKPLRVVIENYPDDLVEEMDAINNPEDSSTVGVFLFSCDHGI